MITGTDTGTVIDFTAGAAVTITGVGQDVAGLNTTAGPAITFATGTIELADASDLTINSGGGAITIKGIVGTSSEAVTLNANKSAGTASATETITIGTDGIGSADTIGATGLAGDDGITLSGNIVLADSAGADLTISDALYISGDVTLETDNTTNDGTITISSTIDGVSGGADDDLIIKAGDNDGDATPGGSLTLSGVIGGSQALTTLDINQSAGNISFTVPQVGSGGNAGVTGATRIGNAASGDIIFSGANANAYNFGGALTVTSNGGAGAFQFTGADPTLTAGGAVTFTEGNGTDDTLVLADLKDLTITTASANANITLPNIDGTAGDGNDGTDLTILAGTGNVSVKSIDTDINDLRIDGTTITLTGDISTAAHNR